MNANDMEKTIEIPEDYEARIEGNKVILERKETDDERIPRLLHKLLCAEVTAEQFEKHGLTVDDALYYLERQKEQRPFSQEDFDAAKHEALWGEQKPTPKFKVGDRIYDKSDSYNRNVIREVGKDYYINAFAQKMDMAYTDANFEFLGILDNDTIDSKPAEWSEEDEDYYDAIIAKLEITQDDALLTDNQMGFLKSLRPQSRWKPSEEQMKALLSKLPVVKGGGDKIQDILESLYDDLKKLM